MKTKRLQSIRQLDVLEAEAVYYTYIVAYPGFQSFPEFIGIRQVSVKSVIGCIPIGAGTLLMVM